MIVDPGMDSGDFWFGRDGCREGWCRGPESCFAEEWQPRCGVFHSGRRRLSRAAFRRHSSCRWMLWFSVPIHGCGHRRECNQRAGRRTL